MSKNKQNKSIMLVDFDDQFFLDVAIDLIKKDYCIPFIITDIQAIYKKNYLKNTRLLDPANYSYKKLIDKLNTNNKESLSAELIKDLVLCENQFLSISDRLNFFPISIRARKHIYQQLLLYWYSFFKKNPIDALVFASTPHMGYQNIMYYVAKKLNIAACYIQRTLISDHVLILDNYQKINKIPSNYLIGKKKKDVINAVGADTYNKIFIPSMWIKKSNRTNRNILNQNMIYLLKEYIKVNFNFFFKFLFDKNLPSAFYFNDETNKIVIGLQSIVRTINTFILKNYYQKHSTRIDWKRKFVFFPLHFQPEKTTSPEGGIFKNQLLAVDILAKSVPKDWMIYIKEHPSQFRRYDLRKKHFRNIDYYKQILAYKNIRLVNLNEDSDQLIENALFTVTITGSAGWQSLLKNKPCIAFGYPWYGACRSCHIVNSIESCKAAVAKIVKERPNEVEINVLKYLAYYKDVFIHSANRYWFAQRSNIPYQTQVDNLANGIIRKISQ